MDTETRKQRLATALDALRDLAADFGVVGGSFAPVMKFRDLAPRTVSELLDATIQELDAAARAEDVRAAPVKVGDEITVEYRGRFRDQRQTTWRETILKVTPHYIYTQRTHPLGPDDRVAHTSEQSFRRHTGVGHECDIARDDLIRIERSFAPKRAKKK